MPVKVKSDLDVTVEVSTTVTVKAGTTATVKAGASATVEAPTITLKGNVTIVSNLDVTGAFPCNA